MKYFYLTISIALAVLSLLICLAAASIWVRSRYVGDEIAWNNGMGRTRQIDSCAGTLQFSELNSSPAGMAFTSPATVIVHRPISTIGTWRVFWGVEPNDVVWEAGGFAVLVRSYMVFPPGGSGFSGGSGFGGGRTFPRATGTASFLAVVIPYWFIMLITSILPIRGGFRWRKNRRIARRAKAGCCVVCGYDLRATPDRCPECGTVPAH